MDKKKFKIAYVTYANIPSKHAHSIHIMEMCSSLGKYVDLTLVIPFFASHHVYPSDIFEYYGVKKTFKIKRIYVLDFLFFTRYLHRLASLLFHLHDFLFSFISLFYLLIVKERYNLIYTRDPHVAFVFSFFKPVIYETHAFTKSSFYHILERNMLKRILYIVYLTPYLKYLYEIYYKFNTPSSVIHDAVNLKKVSNIKPKKLPKDKPIIGYIGSVETLGSKKGIEIILDAAKEIKEAIFYIIGFKTDDEYKRYKALVEQRNLKNVILLKRLPHKEAISYLKSFDIALLPLPRTTFNAYFTSPMKLFEYMAAKKCIIASDLPSIRAIISDNECLFFKPGDSKDLANKIRYALKHKKECNKKAQNAYKKVMKNYTWDNRARKVLEFLKFWAN